MCDYYGCIYNYVGHMVACDLSSHGYIISIRSATIYEELQEKRFKNKPPQSSKRYDFLAYIIVKIPFLILKWILELKITLNSIKRVITTIVDYQEFLLIYQYSY